MWLRSKQRANLQWANLRFKCVYSPILCASCTFHAAPCDVTAQSGRVPPKLDSGTAIEFVACYSSAVQAQADRSHESYKYSPKRSKAEHLGKMLSHRGASLLQLRCQLVHLCLQLLLLARMLLLHVCKPPLEL